MLLTFVVILAHLVRMFFELLLGSRIVLQLLFSKTPCF